MKKLINFVLWLLDIPPFKCSFCNYEGDEPLTYGENGTYVKSCPKCYHETVVTFKNKQAQ